MIPGAALVKRLLEYLEQLEKLKIKPVFEVPRTPFVAHQHELLRLPDLAFNLQSDGDDVWLQFPRLDEIPPPPLSAFLSPWVILHKDPSRDPELRSEIQNTDEDPAFLKLDDHPNVRASFEWYVGNMWTPWTVTEVPRRKARALYNRLFELHQTMASDGTESPLELVWGVGYATWKKQGCPTPVRHPLITQVCEVSLNSQTYDLEIRPRNQDPKLEIDCYTAMDVVGVRPLDAAWRATLASTADRINPFDDSTFAGILRNAVGHLDASGTFRAGMGGEVLPQPSEHLQVTDSWVLFARKRSADILLKDIERLKEEVEKATELPPVVRALVTRGADTIMVNPEIHFRGLSNSESTPDVHELYFPMAYNDEQVSIVGKLQCNDGVVVQGPPGTGKTHTIANVICHYLAQGKRVLVTSKGESALAVLQDKLPEKIRPLSVALLASDREGMKQFEHSIQQIASTVTAYSPTRAERAIQASEADLDRLHGKIATVDRQIADAAAHHLRSYHFQGESLTAVELAQIVVAQAATHAWFDDALPPGTDGDLSFDAAELVKLKQCRLEVGENLAYLEHSVPHAAELPSAVELVSLHLDLVTVGSIQADIAAGDVLALADARTKTFERARSFLHFLMERRDLRARLASAGLVWTTALVDRVRAAAPGDQVLGILYRLCDEVGALENERQNLLAHAVLVPDGAELDDDYREALRRLMAGQKAFLLPIGKAHARKLLAATNVGGEGVRTPDGWLLVDQLVRWRVESRKISARWRTVAGELGLDTPADNSDASIRSLSMWASHVMQAQRLVAEFECPLKQRAEEVFGQGVGEAIAAGDEGVHQHAILSLRSHVERNKLAYATERVAAVRTKLSEYSGEVVEQADALLAETIGKLGTSEAAIHAQWGELLAKFDRLTGLRPALDEIERICSALHSAGAEKVGSPGTELEFAL